MIQQGTISELRYGITRFSNVIMNLEPAGPQRSAIIKNLPEPHRGYGWQRELIKNSMKPIQAKNVMVTSQTNIAELVFYHENDRQSARDILARNGINLIY